MRKYLFYLSAVMYALLTLCLTSCGDDDDDYYEPPQESNISLSTYDITFPSDGGTRTVTLVSDGYISNARSSASWISINKSSQYVSLVASKNYSSSQRSCIVEVTNQNGRTAVVDITQLGTSNSGGNEDAGNGNNTGNDNGNSGNGNNTGNDNGNSGNGGSDSGKKKPDAPSNLRISEIGNASFPRCVLQWNESQGATKYTIYRSTKEYSGYSQIGTSEYCSYWDETIKIGNTYYYKVTASNSYGTSDYSNTVTCEFNDTRKPGPPVYGNCTATSTTITLRWSTPTDASYGKPTKHIVRAWNPYAEEWQDVETLSGTATSASFSYYKYIDNDGYVKCGVIAENDYGTATQGVKVYDSKAKRWLN